MKVFGVDFIEEGEFGPEQNFKFVVTNDPKTITSIPGFQRATMQGELASPLPQDINDSKLYRVFQSKKDAEGMAHSLACTDQESFHLTTDPRYLFDLDDVVVVEVLEPVEKII